MIPTIDFREGAVMIIDQTLLPLEEKVLRLKTVDEVAEAISSLRVRGAPAIGIAAAYAVLLDLCSCMREAGADEVIDRVGMREVSAGVQADIDGVRKRLSETARRIRETRPTAVNLFWALERMMSAVDGYEGDASGFWNAVAAEAFTIHEEELEMEKELGMHGSALISDGMTVLTHCNAGGLATAGYGTALGIVYAAAGLGRRVKVVADETRPLLQGARLTAWELARNGIETTVICDGAAHSMIAGGKIDLVVTGADRVARNGDTANKIGTLGLAVSCERFDVPFYVAAPLSSFDPAAESGADIRIELRSPIEVECFQGKRVVPADVRAYNPAFDVTPASMIRGFVTEKGILAPPFDEGLLERGGD